MKTYPTNYEDLNARLLRLEQIVSNLTIDFKSFKSNIDYDMRKFKNEFDQLKFSSKPGIGFSEK